MNKNGFVFLLECKNFKFIFIRIIQHFNIFLFIAPSLNLFSHQLYPYANFPKTFKPYRIIIQRNNIFATKLKVCVFFLIATHPFIYTNVVSFLKVLFDYFYIEFFALLSYFHTVISKKIGNSY